MEHRLGAEFHAGVLAFLPTRLIILAARFINPCECKFVDVGERAAGQLPVAAVPASGPCVAVAIAGELSRSDRQVHGLTSLLSLPQSLVSYHLDHLSKLRAAGPVSMRSGPVGGRDGYDSVDLTPVR